MPTMVPLLALVLAAFAVAARSSPTDSKLPHDREKMLGALLDRISARKRVKT